MCGIYCEIHCETEPLESYNLHLPFIQERGPDLTKSHSFRINYLLQARCYSSILALRGEKLVEQPVCSTDGCLLWNGEAWNIDEEAVIGNDALAVHRLLETAVNEDYNDEKPVATDSHVSKALAKISGPFAFVFVDLRNQKVYFGRDCFGRRSLLIKVTQKTFIISSVAPLAGDVNWVEIPADGTYVLESRPPNLEDIPRGDGHARLSLSCHHFLEKSFSSISHIPYPSHSKYSSLNRAVPLITTPRLGTESRSVSELELLMRRSIKTRVLNLQRLCSDTSILVGKDPEPILGILFSGGLDCTLLARLIHDIYPISESVDLLNVAFENPRILGAQKKGPGGIKEMGNQSCYEECPDRKTGKASYYELQDECHDRKWNFVEINIPYQETLQHRDKVRSLIFPHRTEMDLSIGYALYFASRGIGTVYHANQQAPTQYKSAARVLISGLGADELFGGYQRHMTAFNRHGYKELLNELEIDVNRLGKRNLGRDDRVLSSWGREVRYPYLDEDVVKWAVNAPIWEKCGFQHEHQIHSNTKSSTLTNRYQINNNMTMNAVNDLEDAPAPELGAEKLILRLLAHKLGMVKVAKETKRAIQFGSRAAKMESGKTKGTDLIP